MTAGDEMMSTATGETGVASVAPATMVQEAEGAARKPTMRLEEHLDFSTLGWVKPQIDELLSEARQSLEAYAEDTEDTRLMQSCAGLLHQVLGTLRMVELYGAAELAGEMEQLAEAVPEGKVGDRDVALGALMRGLVQLPDYLDLIESSHKDISIVLLPLLNELRDARGVEALDPRVLFHPDIDRPLPPDAAGARVAYPFADLRQRVTQIRTRFQVQLLAWTQGKQPNFAEMRDAMDELRAVCHAEPARRLWWVAGGVLEALQQGRLDHHLASLRQQFGQLDRTIHRVQDQGEEVCGDEDARELVRTLLFSVANATPGPGRTDIIAQCFALDRMVPSEAELEHARAAMSGRNRALLDTVAKAVREDLLRVKEGLDIFLRRDDRNPQQLAPQVEILHRVGDTLDVLGLEAPAKMIAEQRKVIAAVIDGKREAAPETILDVASALLYVDASLDEHIEHLGAGDGSGEALPLSEGRKIMRALMREAGANLARVKDALTAFIESAWSHQRLADVPKLMAEVGGALRILNLQRPAELVDGIDCYIDNELIVDRRVPTVDEMDTLADAMASVEYYLEIGRDTSSSDHRILDAAQHSLERLHYWPVPRRRAASAPAESVSAESAPAAEAAVPAPPVVAREKPIGKGVPLAVDIPVAPAPTAETPTPGVGPGKWVEVDEEVLEPIEGAGVPVNTAFHDAAGIDEEIREVFVEEVGEEIANINVNLPAWKANPDDLDTLKNVRRSFHTLKGSGRLVGAMALGEFSWKIENMLNRVLDRTIPPDANVQEVVDAAVATLPRLHAGLQGQPVVLDPPLDAIMQVADKLAAGESARIADLSEGYRKVTRKVRRWVPLAEPETAAAAEAPVAVSEHVITSPVTGLPLVDPILLDVLRTEVGQHLQGMRDYLARNAHHDIGVDDELVRAVHTLHGAVAMVGIGSLADMLAPLEVWIRRMHSAGVPLDREGCDAMRDAVAMTDHVMAQFDAPVPDVPDTTALTERLAALRDRWPEAAALGAPRTPSEDVAATAASGFAEEDVDDGIAAVGLAPASTLPTEDDAEALAARAQAERIAVEKAEQERIAAEQAEQQRLDAKRAEQERLAAERVEQERLAIAKAEAERIAAEQAEAERVAAEKAEQERLAAERAEQERLATEKAEAERIAAEQVEAERVAAEKAEQERLAAERAEQERLATEKAEAERITAEQAEAERIAAEKAEQERLAAERVEQERLAAERAEQERLAAEKAEAERIAAARAIAAREIAAAALPSFPDDPQPEGPIDIPGLDPELVGLFTEEGNELLDSSDSLMAALRDAPGDVERVRGLQRNLHTLKGGARVVGIAAVGDLAHAMETLLEKVGDRKRELAPIEVDSLERAFDRLHDMVARIEQGRAVAPPVNAIERFNALAEGRPVDGAAAPAARPEPAKPAPRPAPVAAPAPRLAPQIEDTETRAQAELIRVRSDLLDSLVNAAGEASIYRARLEQQVGNFRFNLVELDQTVARLREQLRKLEIETETQILSRYQRENEAGQGAAFDPLELDRFSNLQQYSRALAESVSDLASIQDILDDQARQSETLLLQQSRVNSDLQDGLMRTRMVPFESMVPNLRRTLRGAADELGKRAQLRVEGAQGEMDRNVLERMKAPFEHMLRNALAHGIEDPAERVARGKPMEGTVTIEVGRRGTEVLVRVSDDGAGFDRDAIRAKAIERGLLQPDVPIADSELFNFVLQTGFSTAGEVSQIAGRGVGMDVVANEIRQLGGSLAIESERGRGTTFNIRLPFTLAVTQAITVRTGDTTFAVPMTSVQAVSRIPRDEMAARMAGGDRAVSYAGEEYQLHELSELLGLPSSHAIEDSTGQLPLLMVRAGDLRAAIHIDSVIGSREIVVKPVGPQISNVPGMFGATIMGDGSVMLILDPAPLVRHAVARQAAAAAGVETMEGQAVIEPAGPAAAVPRAEEGGPRLVMVVDDSITMRKVTTRVLEREQLEVVTAKDGVDALEKLQERIPDVMLLDIEMPRMDGFELATHMKNDTRFRHVPIIMITSRTGEKHRERAFEIGVDRYLGKPYSEPDLLRNVKEMLEARHA
ncbi:MAG: Signal transduction histidine kinase CheA [Rhodanobacteraceae bacterium]|jgi:chemosensory pili system protein ChpA (sensor histidine kinase/response regulator)|nr:MAG: Signal transduction histidine kinase CheA [Rhodanobacteraceae bacterium]